MKEMRKPHWVNRFFGRVIEAGFIGWGWLALRTKRRISPRPAGRVQPLVSVLIPTHNRASLLVRRSLASVLRQTHSNMEIIVCAHGCTDDTVSAVESIRDERIRLLVVPRRHLGYPPSAENHWLVGPVRPLNAGTRAARGDYIAVLGDDDEWEIDHIESSLQILQSSDAEFVSGWANRINPDGTEEIVRGNIYENQEVGSVCTWVYVSYLAFARWNIHSWRKGWDRPNDIDLGRRLIRIGVRHVSTQRIGHTWKTRPGELQMGIEAYLGQGDEMERQFSRKLGSAQP